MEAVSVKGTVGQRLKRLRGERGLSQRELAVPGVSYAYISRIENGARTPSVKALRKLAEKLGVSAEYLETGKKESPFMATLGSRHIYEADEFSIHDLVRSLLESTYSNPLSVRMKVDEGEFLSVVPVNMKVIHLLSSKPGEGEEAVAAYSDSRVFEFDCWIPPSGFNPARGVGWVKVEIRSWLVEEAGKVNTAFIYRVQPPEDWSNVREESESTAT